MENNYTKWVNVSFLSAAVLIGYVIFMLTAKLAAVYDLEARFHEIDWAIRGAGFFAGALSFAILYRHDQANQFMHEVVAELSRVTWPTQKETASATFVVIIMVLISGLYLGLLDYVWTQLLQWIL